MISRLLKLSDRLDQKGLTKLANRVDKILVIFAEAMQGKISAEELSKFLPGISNALKNAITFDLLLERDPKGAGNFVRAIPKIHDKWTDGFNLGDIKRVPGIENYFINEPISKTIEELEKGQWFEEGTDMPFANPEDVEFTPEYLQQLKLQNLEKGRETQKKKRELGEWGEEAIKEAERERFLPESERSEEAKHYDLPTVPPSGFKYDPEWKAQEDEKKKEERRRMLKMRESNLMSLLVKMADQFDQNGDIDLATEVDHTIKSIGARPKSPLKGLDDDVKKSLIIFLHNAGKNMKSSIGGLNEFFRRLRYFDVVDSIRDIGLDRTVKDMEKVQENLDDALRRFYEITHGKRPSKKELSDMFADTIDAGQQGALDFFDTQMAKDKKEEVEEEENEEVEPEEAEEPEEKEDGANDDFLLFWDEGE